MLLSNPENQSKLNRTNLNHNNNLLQETSSSKKRKSLIAVPPASCRKKVKETSANPRELRENIKGLLRSQTTLPH
ncbi:hypothetical protein PGT21_026317 [Puccinia graminis f. sp. tritici]|uniref:Uncharacterized protein n=1 Tax=Puccinia graminis f. sp. tritici TaxID=56615 RepID=A0A5B0LQ21_PUCGR|nr:hypothetical protein PGT21_026317 [Puccinia graminis f. sp. tritici]